MPASTLDKTFELHTAKVIGTASYLAPEVMSFQITAKLDSFSFGVVLLEVLTGNILNVGQIIFLIKINCFDISSYLNDILTSYLFIMFVYY